ncbi:MAG TPA: glycosyltransferase family 2 protein [Pirellulales bacterium]|nr:glycosyltransferase family 2 protein [Pirellulales bacterium]
MGRTAPLDSTRSAPPEIAPEVAAPRADTPAAPTPIVCVPGLTSGEFRALEAAFEVLGPEMATRVGGFVLPADFTLSVLMPVYNERDTVLTMIDRVCSLGLPVDLIVVDDFSTDGTRELLEHMPQRAGVTVLFHDRNRGKGAALRTALGAARGEAVVVQDADLEYDPHDYTKLLEPIITGRADVVFGSRYLNRSGNRQWLRYRIANWLLTRLSNWFTGLKLSDMETCYKMFRRSALAGLTIEQDRFGVEPELTAKIARRGCRVVEVPISYTCRDTAHGKKIRLRDAIQALWCIVRYSCL